MHYRAKRFSKFGSALMTSVAVGLLAGCAVAPTPLDMQSSADGLQSALTASYGEQEPINGRGIDLSEAMARAVLYNLDHRVDMLEAALKGREAETATLGMLPQLVAGAGYRGRSNVDASSSQSLSTGLTSLETSTSQDRYIRTTDLALTWNVLDFGLSYVRAKQASDRALVAEEQRRRILGRIVEEVRGAYWRAIAAENLSTGLRKVEQRLQGALEQAQMLAAGGQTGPVVALTYQRDLYETKERIQQVQAEVVASRTQLAALMNVPPNAPFRLVRPAAMSVSLAALGKPDTMVRTALENRPEVRSALLEKRIGGLDGTAALLELLPSLNFSAGPNTTSNSFTAYNYWAATGAQASLNLMKLATYPVRANQIEAQDQLLDAKLKATAAAVVLQVHVARARYQQSLDRAQTLANYSSVQQRLLTQMAASATAEKSGEIELVREELTAMLARARLDMAVAETQSAYAALQTSMGRDSYPAALSATLPELAAAFRGRPVRAVALQNAGEKS